jgi:hypothetical protein
VLRLLVSRIEKRRKNSLSQKFIPVNFSVGDFVLVAIVSKRQRKLHAKWRGPYRVVRCISSHIYECEDLVLNIRIQVHVRRIKFFASSDMDVSIPLLDIISSQDNWATDFYPETILDFMVDSGQKLYLRIKWLGFSELESTWEPVEIFYVDAPEMVHAFLDANPNRYFVLREFISSLTTTRMH